MNVLCSHFQLNKDSKSRKDRDKLDVLSETKSQRTWKVLKMFFQM